MMKMKRWASAAMLALSGVTPLLAHAEAAAVSPRYVTMPQHTYSDLHYAPAVSGAQLAQWNGVFVDQTGATVQYTMAGLDPAGSNVTTTMPVVIIPVKMVYGAKNGNMTFDPTTKTVSNGLTVINSVLASPLFTTSTNFTTGGVNLGTTQYIDAFQRGNFWGSVSINTSYHTLLSPKVLPTLTIHVTKSQGAVHPNPFVPGASVGEMGINAFDHLLQKYLTSNAGSIQPNTLPVFITNDVFLTQGGCCIGGYHSATASQPGGQTYAHASYVTSPGSFSQDVSALSHELGEWMDDPFVDNAVNCTNISVLEVGDPLEGDANYGGYPYTSGGFTYNLQSLIYMPYWGAPKSTTVNGWYSFQGEQTTACGGQ